MTKQDSTQKTPELKEATKYSGSYNGVYFLISLHGVGEPYRPEGTWCYYLLINEKQLPDEYRDDFILKPEFDDKDRLSHPYISAKIADLDWHHGITYYGKEGGADGEPITIKIGCDYAHYWDEGKAYSQQSVLYDAQQSINKLFEMFPDIKIYSHYYGGYFKRDDGEFNEHGSFVAFEEKERWDAEYGKKEESK